MKLHHRVTLYSVGGVFAEILFTSLTSLVLRKDITLHGKTQLWVILLYGFGGLWFETLERALRQRSSALRLGTYVANIWAIEYAAGYILERFVIGTCPWRYTGWTNLHGYIQFSHLPAWLILSAIAERLIVYLRTHKLVPIVSPDPIAQTPTLPPPLPLQPPSEANYDYVSGRWSDDSECGGLGDDGDDVGV